MCLWSVSIFLKSTNWRTSFAWIHRWDHMLSWWTTVSFGACKSSILDHEFTITTVPRLQCEDVVVFTSSCLDVLLLNFRFWFSDASFACWFISWTRICSEKPWNVAQSRCTSCNFPRWRAVKRFCRSFTRLGMFFCVAFWLIGWCWRAWPKGWIWWSPWNLGLVAGKAGKKPSLQAMRRRRFQAQMWWSVHPVDLVDLCAMWPPRSATTWWPARLMQIPAARIGSGEVMEREGAHIKKSCTCKPSMVEQYGGNEAVSLGLTWLIWPAPGCPAIAKKHKTEWEFSDHPWWIQHPFES